MSEEVEQLKRIIKEKDELINKHMEIIQFMVTKMQTLDYDVKIKIVDMKR